MSTAGSTPDEPAPDVPDDCTGRNPELTGDHYRSTLMRSYHPFELILYEHD